MAALSICKKCKNKGKTCEFNAEYTCEAIYRTLYLANFNNKLHARHKKEKAIEYNCNFTCDAFAFEEMEKKNAE
jgi:hypothetical protein